MTISTASCTNATADDGEPCGWTAETTRHAVVTSFGPTNVRVGGNDRGLWMVFWPSLLLDASMWSFQYEHYAPDYRIALIDPPGIGASAPFRRAITVEESAECLIEILDGLGIATCVLVGNSWGALVAGVVAARHPERLRAAIITNGTATPASAEIRARITELVDNLERCDTMPDWLLPATREAFSGPTAEVERPGFLAYLRRVLDEDPRSVANAMRGILLGRPDLHETMREIRGVPVLVVAGEEDRFFGIEEARGLADAIDGSRFVLLPKTGHLSTRECPHLVNDEIDRFLADRLREAA